MTLRRAPAALCALLCAASAAAADPPPPEVEDRPPPPQLSAEHPEDTGSLDEIPLPPRRFRSDLERAEDLGTEVSTVVVSKAASEEGAGAWCDQLEHDRDLVLDRARRKLEEMACTTSLWVDGLFGEVYHVDAARRAYGRLEISQSYSEYYGERLRIRFDVRARFPNIDRRLSGFVGRDDDEDFVRDRNERFALRSRFPQIEDRDSWLAGLGYSLPGGRSFRSEVRVGVRGLLNTRLFAHYRASYIPYSDDDNLVFLRATPFWNTDDGFGTTVGGDYSHVFSDTRLLRWANTVTRSENTAGLDWRSALIHYRALSGGRGLAFELFVRGASGLPVPLTEYGSHVVFRHPVVQRRMWTQWVVGYSWPKEDPEERREGAFNAGVGLSLPFGQKHD